MFFKSKVSLAILILFASTSVASDDLTIFEGQIKLESSIATLMDSQISSIPKFQDTYGFKFFPLSVPSSHSKNDYLSNLIVRGQADEGGGSGAADATDPSAILTQFQVQNIFTPATYDSHGYSNAVILQPVLPFPVAMPWLKEYFPNHIIRPTLPIIAPTANPDGALGSEGGLGDMTILDVAIHPIEGFGNLLFGYNAVLPTSTNSLLGLGEWQLGPAAGVMYKQIPKTLLGLIVTTQFSLESDAQKINVQPIFIKHLPKEWYVGWGEMFWEFDTNAGEYKMPLQVRVGKVTKIGKQPVNIFVQPYYTPDGLRNGPSDEWGVKLNVTFLFPDKKFGPLFGYGKEKDSCVSTY